MSKEQEILELFTKRVNLYGGAIKLFTSPNGHKVYSCQGARNTKYFTGFDPMGNPLKTTVQFNKYSSIQTDNRTGVSYLVHRSTGVKI